MATQISGPSFYAQIVTDRNFLLLGEYHTLTDLCSRGIDTPDWLITLMSESPHDFQIFVEFPLTDNMDHQKIDYQSPLGKFISKFKSCGEGNSRCLVNNLVVYPIDIRYRGQEPKSILSIWANYLFAHHRQPSIPHNIPINKILYYLIYQDISYHQSFVDLIKILHTLILGTPAPSNLINEELSTVKEIHRQYLSPLLSRTPDKFLHLFYKLKLDHLVTGVDSLVAEIWELSGILMDMYTLLLMIQAPGPQVIFYGGKHHSRFYTTFLSAYYDVNPEIIIDNKVNTQNFQCINLMNSPKII